MRKEVKKIARQFKKESLKLTKAYADCINMQISKEYFKTGRGNKALYIKQSQDFIDRKLEVFNENLEEIFERYNEQLDDMQLTVLEEREVKKIVLNPLFKTIAKLNKSLTRFDSSFNVQEL